MNERSKTDSVENLVQNFEGFGEDLAEEGGFALDAEEHEDGDEGGEQRGGFGFDLARGPAAFAGEDFAEERAAGLEGGVDALLDFGVLAGEFGAEDEEDAAGGGAAMDVVLDELLEEGAEDLGGGTFLAEGTFAELGAEAFGAADGFEHEAAFIAEAIVETGAGDAEFPSEIADAGAIVALAQEEAHGLLDGGLAIELQGAGHVRLPGRD